VLSVDGVYTLVDIVIADPTQVDLVSQVVFFLRGCNNSCDSSEGWFLSQLIPSGHVSPSSCGGF
jgi:hypothetical protein